MSAMGFAGGAGPFSGGGRLVGAAAVAGVGVKDVFSLTDIVPRYDSCLSFEIVLRLFRVSLATDRL